MSNHSQEAEKIPPLFFWSFSGACLFFLVFLVGPAAKAQKLGRDYVSSQRAGGNIFFIRPQKGFKNRASGSRLIYDMTSISGNDSVTFNFSLYDKTGGSPDSLIFSAGKSEVRVPLQKLFVETKGNKWHYRFSARLLTRELVVFFDPGLPGLLMPVQNGQRQKLSCRKKRWSKLARLNRRIFQLIDYNKPLPAKP